MRLVKEIQCSNDVIATAWGYLRNDKCWVTALSFCTQKVSITHLLAEDVQAIDVRMHMFSTTCGSVSLQKSATRFSSQLLIAAMPAESAFAAFSRSSKSSMEARLCAKHEHLRVVQVSLGSTSQIAGTVGRSNAMNLHFRLQFELLLPSHSPACHAESINLMCSIAHFCYCPQDRTTGGEENTSQDRAYVFHNLSATARCQLLLERAATLKHAATFRRAVLTSQGLAQ